MTRPSGRPPFRRAHIRARYYDPETGRFVQRDPTWDAGNVGGQYTFCGNGPVSGRDPSGEQGAGGNPRTWWPDNTSADQVDSQQDYLHSQDYFLLARDDPKRLQEFYAGFMSRHGDTVEQAASEAGVPAWLVAGVLTGESINMDSSRGPFSERTLERMGFGGSVGLGQITFDTAVQRGLTPSAVAYAQLMKSLQSMTSADARANPGAAYGIGPELMRLEAATRSELLDPRFGIPASAKYLRQLLDEAVKAARECEGDDPSNQFGSFDWKGFDGDFDKLALSMAELKNAPPGTDPLVTGRAGLVGFFGAAHNDNRATGQYARGSGEGQGQWARRAFSDLFRFGLLPNTR